MTNKERMSLSLIKELRHFPEFVKLSHSVFALPFAFAAMIFAAHGFPAYRTTFLIIAAVITARSTAMAFNRIVDIRYDSQNPRTANRHLPSGQISISTAWLIVMLGGLLFILISVCINKLTAWLLPVALAVVLGYSFTKRFTSWSHFFLGASLSLAPLGAWAAVRGNLYSIEPWMLAFAVICWVAGFDMIYAFQDMDFDRNHGLYSMAATLGPKRTRQWVQFLHGIMFFILIELGLLLNFKYPYFLGLGIVLMGLIWEHWLMQQPEEKALQFAFLEANAVVSFGYLISALLGVFL